MAKPPTEAQIATVQSFLPSIEADPATWDHDKIVEEWTVGVAGTIRKYWYVRTTETAGYMDLPDPGGTLPITQIHRQAKEMLDYWDKYIAQYGAGSDPSTNAGGITGSVGKIKKRYQKTGVASLNVYNSRTPYQRT